MIHKLLKMLMEMQITSDFDLLIGIRRKILSTSFRQKLI